MRIRVATGSLKLVRGMGWAALVVLQGCGSGDGGSASASASRRPLPIALRGWYITQAVQKLDHSVPLVAGRDGMLRVFLLANQQNDARPAVRVTITGGTPSPWQATIAPSGASVPTAFHEEDLQDSWNLPIPGAVLAPGGHVELEVVQGQGPDHPRLEAALTVQRVDPIRIQLVPVTQGGRAGEVLSGGRTLESWVARFKAMYPVARVQVRVGAPLVSAVDFSREDPDRAWVHLLGELEHLREAAERRGEVGWYYYGVVSLPQAQGDLGQTPVQHHSAAGTDALATYQDTLAHEMGHALGQPHAPCGVEGPFGSWPADPGHANAGLGAMGLDVAARASKASSQFHDIMSYCPPYWVSEHTYRSILDYRRLHPFWP